MSIENVPAHQSSTSRVYRAFSPAEFIARRQALSDRIGSGAIAVLAGAGPVRGFNVFRQTNDFYYLCGVEFPQAYLLMEGGSRRTTLFLPERDPHADRSEGPGASSNSPESLLAISGADEVRPLSDLGRSIPANGPIYLPLRPAETIGTCRDTLVKAYAAIAANPWDGRPSREERFADQLRKIAPGRELRDISPLLDELRSVKSPAEVAVMRCAGRLAGRAVAEAIRSTAPGVVEKQLGAVADYVYLTHGAAGGGYRPIIAGGDNIWYPHYFRNDCPLRDGDLVLMDYAPEVNYYTSDIGRMWPTNGKYSPWQRELYGFIVEYHKTLLRYIRPGADDKQILAEAAVEMEKTIARWQFSKPCYADAARRTLSFAGHLSHPVGMSVHDAGEYHGGPLQAGAVFAVDPQMWVPEEKLYIRVEDTVAVTPHGVEVLTSTAPLELDDIEKLARQDGLLQTMPPDESLNCLVNHH
jgi:Xaa-Pro aminopeptidase